MVTDLELVQKLTLQEEDLNTDDEDDDDGIDEGNDDDDDLDEDDEEEILPENLYGITRTDPMGLKKHHHLPDLLLVGPEARRQRSLRSVEGGDGQADARYGA